MNPNKIMLVGLCALSASSQADVLISEYIEGSSFNKAIEIANYGDQAVDLASANYQLRLFSNGATSATNTQDLSGVLAPGETLVYVNSNAVIGNNDNALIPVGVGIESSVVNFNGDDALGLYANDVLVDRVGQIGVRETWGDGGASTKDQTLRRLSESTPDNDNNQEFVISSRWFNYAKDTVDGLGCIGQQACDDTGGPIDPPVSDIGQCGDPSTAIHSIRSGNILGQEIVVEAVVVGDFQGNGTDNQLSGFFVQHADANWDADAQTSEGIFVYHFNDPVTVGQRVRVQATVAEYSGGNQLKDVAALLVCGNEDLPSATTLTLPLVDQDLYHLEGMRVSLPQTLHVTPAYTFNRYGESVLSLGKRFKSTQVYPANTPEAAALADANMLNRLVLDDGLSSQNPDEISYFPNFSALNSLRAGSQMTGVEGVINYSFGQFRVQPTALPTVIDANPRTAAPELDELGNLSVASFNVLNFFTDLDIDNATDFRGADTAEEFERQRAKIVSAMVAMNANVVGLMEIQNNGFAADSAIQNLIDAVNAQLPEALHYVAVKPLVDRIGNDMITVGIIYQPEAVQANGDAELIHASPFDADTAKHRVPLVQQFSMVDGGESFYVAVNHFKSKGSNCNALGDPDMGDGQGNCNGQRTLAAQTLSQFFSEKQNVLLLGDFNAYAKEDPMLAFEAAGFNNLVPMFEANSYSYYYDEEAGSLDHALADAALTARVLDATDWHINADEPTGLDYNTEYKSDAQLANFYAPNAYRASDHDPVVISLDMRSAGAISVAAQANLVEGTTSSLVFERLGGDFGDVVVKYQVVAGSADASDLALESGELVWGANDMSSQTLNLAAFADELVEGQETAYLMLSIEQGTAKLVVPKVELLIDDATALTVSMAQAQIEVDEAAGSINIPVVLNGEATSKTSAWVLVLPSSASWRDYRAPFIQRVTWNEGESGVKNVSARIIDDRRSEADESFKVLLFGAYPTALGNITSTWVTIKDND
ncbi:MULTISPECIES: ExeM/NucH family extracellular endonuclease [unclassified Agarivorans]|uniref:ExeM/NucH family extracellular endonuclease n=1 Tax=unclassified Agarivorans TaxID=2636026 RepID=UPI0026E39AF0|nr:MULTISPECIES: ExeM/NucH family extracellular endonuclease [unclassified Agarivorans]MDO6684487.1 ExeM/NucH family extracellular endonuclease [Agarivorans sp. 3_MG-2023]MDO6714652.1 ExeM/NucH family extracellular endonuclease [Agarivorans sp. 2_MG-2023]